MMTAFLVAAGREIREGQLASGQDFPLTPAETKRGEAPANVIVCGLLMNDNLGEKFIANSLKYLLQKQFDDGNTADHMRFIDMDLLGRKCLPYGTIPERWLTSEAGSRRSGLLLQRIDYKLNRFIDSRIHSLWLKNIFNSIEYGVWYIGTNMRRRLKKYFEECLLGADLIVIDGGGLLEHGHNQYQKPLRLLTELAKKKNIPVIYNAIGRAGKFVENDSGCRIPGLSKALRPDIVKYVSARDSVEDIQKCVGTRLKVKLLADAAFWMKEAYGIVPRTDRKMIGIGLIRGNCLTGYGYDFTEAQWIKLFAGIARELALRGYEFRFFTNGVSGDYKLGRKVIQELGLSDDSLIPHPSSADELIDTINSFRAIVTCRMHSAIAAFTMGIPAVILSWNDKVEKLMEIIGYPERAIKKTEFDAKLIVDRMETALTEGVDENKVQVMKDKALESVRDYRQYLKKR